MDILISIYARSIVCRLKENSILRNYIMHIIIHIMTLKKVL